MKQTYLHKYFISILLLLCGVGMLQAQTVRDTFRYSGQIVTWTVPTGVSSVTIEARGAEGGNAPSSTLTAGKGASISGTVAVTPGQLLSILVGGQPAQFNNGGGGSFVVTTANMPLVIAGGGGGSGFNNDSEQKHGQAATSGGAGAGGGGAGGVDGQGGKSTAFNMVRYGAGGGLLTDGEGDGNRGGKAFVNGGTGGFNGLGGFGGGGTGTGTSNGGGGGGYSGGGVGGATGIFGVGGGGGSFNNGTNQMNASGVNSGNGLVTITYTIPPPSITCGRDTIVYSTANQCSAVVNYTAPALPQNSFTQTVSDTFRFTGARQLFTVPAGVSGVIIKAWGAQGGSGGCSIGGLGGYATGTLSVNAGSTLHVYVGGYPGATPYNSIQPGGFNGGGNALQLAGAGGGASDVRTGDTSLTSRVIVAGGGGGDNRSTNCYSGGAGGGTAGNAGTNTVSNSIGGGGGTQSTGGAAGFNGQAGSLGQGGNGNTTNPNLAYYAGGGGGYYGGGSALFAGAGGGSGYIGGVTNGSMQIGIKRNNGMVVITYDAPVMYSLTQTAGLPSGSSFPVGNTVNTYVLYEGNTPLDTCSFVVTVRDTIKPVITAPVTVTVNTNPGVCSASNVALGTPNASDNCLGVTVTNNAPAIFPKGTTTVTYTVKDSSGNTATATQMVTVVDNEKPVITCPAAQQFCFSSTGMYNIPTLNATDNCGIQSTTYSITGATTRNGDSNNASGGFAPGTSTITFTVRDASNNVSTCSTTVRVNSQIVVSISDSKALNSNGVMANTVYVGYTPASSITLTANASGGSGNYTYLWSNGKTTRSITVSPTTNTTYTVTVKDGSNCTGMVSKTVSVINVRCGNKLDKVSVCHDGNTICIDPASVPNHLNHRGDMLGACGSGTIASRTSASAISSTEETAAVLLATSVYPNPNKGQFSVRLNTTTATKAEVQVVSAQGIIISRKTVQPGGKNQTIPFNLSSPVAGTYLIKIVSDEGVQVMKMMVQP